MTDHEARTLAHEVFDKLWLEGWLKRSQAYDLLTRKMGLGEDVHMGMLNQTQCEKVKGIAKAEMLRLKTALGKPPYPPVTYPTERMNREQKL